MIKQAILLLFLIAVGFNLSAQIQQKSLPKSFSLPKKAKCKFINIKPPGFDKRKQTQTKKLCFATKIDTLISITSDKNIFRETDKETIWQIGITAKEALSLNFTFVEYKLTKGAKLFVYSADKKHILGAFTEMNNKKSGILPTLPIESDSVIIEFSQYNAFAKSKIKIGSIGYGYKAFYPKKNIKSGSCNVDVNCSEGLPWYMQKRGIAKIVINNGGVCTGTLINNTLNNGKPYLLTANHCFEDGGEPENSLFIFNFETIECAGSTIADFYSIAGAEMRATPSGGKLDFALVELSTPVPDYFLPFFAGWNVSENIVNQATTLHHPDGDVKKISVTEKALRDSSFSGYIGNSHFKVVSWDLGTTEAGSSGAPLYNQNLQIIGDLTGGIADCSEPDGWDMFAKLSYSWDYYSAQSEQLKAWLNPDNQNITELAGYTPFPIAYDHDAACVKINKPNSEECSNKAFTPEVLIANQGFSILKSAKIECFVNNNLTETLNWTGNLRPYETEKVTFPGIVLTSEVYALKFVVSLPNGFSDQDNSNNELTKNFNVIDGLNYQLVIKTDNYGSETLWTVTNEQNGIILNGGPYLDNLSETYTYSICLQPEKCYKFTITDAADDGICCDYGNGSYELFDGNGNSIFSGGDFTNKSEYSFCTQLSVFSKEAFDNIDFFPNPTEDYLVLKYDFLEPISYALYDALGNKLISEPVENRRISVSNLPAGVYILELFGENDYVKTMKFVKQ